MAEVPRGTGVAQELSPTRRWLATAVLGASLLVITMDMTILNIALPEIAADVQPTSDQQLWIVDVYSLVLAGLLVSFAAIGDRWGRKRLLLTGYVIFALASAAVLLIDTAPAIIAVRGLLGVGGAMIMPTTISLIRVIFTDPKERATALSVWAAVSGLGAAAGPLVGGWLLEHFSWHAAFLVNLPLMAAGTIAGALILPESRVRHMGPWDGLAAALSLVGMTLLVWAVKQFGKEASFAVPAAWAAAAVAAVALTWFAVRCVRSAAPLLDLRLFRSRTFSSGIIAALGSMFAMLAALLLIAQWLQLVDGASPLEAGMRLIPLAIAAAVASLLAPALARRVGSRAVLAGGLAVAGAGMVYVGIQGPQLTLAHVLVAMALVGAGMGSLAIGTAMVMSGSPEEKAGNAGALEETAYELGGTLGVAVLGSISAVIYRAELAADGALAGMDPALLSRAEESLGAAVAISERAHLPQLAERAAAAFVRSLEVAGFTGGVIMLGVAAAVFLLTPKGTNVTAAAHSTSK